MTLEMLGEQKEKYGQQRLWGAIAAAALSTGCGQVIQAISAPPDMNYLPAFINFSIWSLFSLITLLVSYRYKKTPRCESPRDMESLQNLEEINPRYPDIAVAHSPLSDVLRHPKSKRHWLLHLDVASFYIAVFAFSMVSNCTMTFVWPYLQNEKGASMTLTSISGASPIVLDIPFFYYSDHVPFCF